MNEADAARLAYARKMASYSTQYEGRIERLNEFLLRLYDESQAALAARDAELAETRGQLDRSQKRWQAAVEMGAETDKVLAEARAEIERLKTNAACRIDEIKDLTQQRDDYKAGYLRRHKDACDRWLRIEELEAELSRLRAQPTVSVDNICEEVADAAIENWRLHYPDDWGRLSIQSSPVLRELKSFITQAAFNAVQRCRAQPAGDAMEVAKKWRNWAWGEERFAEFVTDITAHAEAARKAALEEAAQKIHDYANIVEPAYQTQAMLGELINSVRALAAAPQPSGQEGDKPHDLFKTGDLDAPDIIKDRNGEVVLGLCRICGKVESQLDKPCSGYRHDNPEEG